MNPIRGLAEQITRVASGINSPETYSISDLSIQPPSIISPPFQLFDSLISDSPSLVLAESKPSANLLLQIPGIQEISQPLTAPETAPYLNLRITLPEVDELTNWLIAVQICSSAYAKVFTVPKIFQEEIVGFKASLLTVQKHLFVPLSIAQISDNPSTALTISQILDCCFEQNNCRKELEQCQEPFEGRKNKQESKDLISSLPNGYCDILYPLLLPPLSLEAHNSLDFHNPLRGYQKQGIRFLFEHQSALLADEMGTGKTVQAVNALRLLFRQACIKSALIVCPPAVIGSVDLSIQTGSSEGWSGHFYHWAPELKVAVIRGGKQEQRKVDWQNPFHVYITTYDTLRSDLNTGILTNTQQFDCIVLDEAQTIKNRGTQRARAIRCLQANYRWALTGTPIENHQNDVISLFDFIRPGTFLGNVEYSSEHVSKTIEPYMRRRLKKDVLQELPEKQYVERYLELDQYQKVNYDQAMEEARREITTALNGDKQNQVTQRIRLSLLPKLKQICNFAEGSSTSPKANLLLELLETIAANQEKALVFSQYLAEGINKIANLLDKNQIVYVRYTGQESQQEKEATVGSFRSDPKITAFLATTQTAGYGITLTEATYVIHFDHLWNPAKMQNAEDRVHRIGQKKGVTIYSFWMANTIESRIKQKLIYKCNLIDKTINSLATGLSEDDLSIEDWLDIFDIRLARRANEIGRLEQKAQARRSVAKSFLQDGQNKLSPPANSSYILREIEQIKEMMETIKNSPQHTFIFYGNYIEKSIKEITLVTEQQPIFNQQNATIGVNYAAPGSRQELTQNATTREQNFEALLTDFEQFINELQQKHPDATNETAIQIIDIEAKELQRTQPLRWQNFLNLKRLWNGGKKAAFKVGEHYAEQNPLGKGAIAFLEGVMEEPK